jgi:DNA polymerase
MEAVKKKTTVVFNNLTFSYQSGFLFITLPSGRRLAYVKPRIGKNQFDSDAITYEGVGTAKKWERQETYGPKLVENIVQATSRDILCYAMKNLKNERICMHIHDELVIEGNGSLEEICDIMGQTPSWAEGLVLRADGDTMEFYQKA